jgi:hypothetical protein
MKPCFEFKNWQQKASDGALTPADEARFEQHRVHCPKCAQAYQWQQNMELAFHQASEIKAPEDFNQRVWDKIRVNETAPALSRGWLPALGLAFGVAALAAATVMTGYWVMHRPSNTESQIAKRKAPQEQLVVKFLEETHPAAQATAPITMNPAPEKPQTAKIRPTPGHDLARKPEPEKAQPGEKRPLVAEQRIPGPDVPQARAESHGPSVRVAPPQAQPERKIAGNNLVPAAALGPTVTVPVGTIRIRPNKINVSQQERMLLEVNLEKNGRLEARIYTREGQAVRTLVEGDVPAGVQSWEWQGDNNQGGKVAAGIYMLEIRGDVGERKFKIMVIR